MYASISSPRTPPDYSARAAFGLIDSGHLTETLLSEFERFFADPGYWTSAITFIASSGRRAV
ncbi:MAG TPA: hypothetical protein VGG59_03375, partial [Acidobacteriaceae bacterium]